MAAWDESMNANDKSEIHLRERITAIVAREYGQVLDMPSS
jgi:hypothetical protein